MFPNSGTQRRRWTPTGVDSDYQCCMLSLLELFPIALSHSEFLTAAEASFVFGHFPLLQRLLDLVAKVLFMRGKRHQCLVHVELVSLVRTEVELQSLELLGRNLSLEVLHKGLVSAVVELVEVWVAELPHGLVVVAVVVEFIELVRGLQRFIDKCEGVRQLRLVDLCGSGQQFVYGVLQPSVKYVRVAQVHAEKVKDYLQLLVVSA